MDDEDGVEQEHYRPLHYEQRHSPQGDRSTDGAPSDAMEFGRAAEAAEAEADAETEAEQAAVNGGSMTGGLTPFTSPDYFTLLSYTFLREQRQRQKQRRSVRLTRGPLTTAQLLAIGDGTAAVVTTTTPEAAADERMGSVESQAPMDEREDDDSPGVAESVQRTLCLGPVRLLPALLPPSAAESDYVAKCADDESSADEESLDASGPSWSLSPASVTATDSGTAAGGTTGLQSSSFVTGYYDRFFVRVRKLGSGSYGAVYLTYHMLEGVQLGHYACKIIPVGDSKSWLQRVVAEVRALESVHHRHIVSYRHSWLEMAQVADFGPPVPCLFLLMQYCDLGTVAQLVWPANSKATRSERDSRACEQHRDAGWTEPLVEAQSCEATVEDEQREQVERIRARRRNARREEASEKQEGSATPLSVNNNEEKVDEAAPPSQPLSDDVVYLLESDVWWIFLDACLGLRHLHRCGILHMDLKLDNLLVTADRDARGRVQGRHVLLSDMGNAIIKGDAHQRTGNTGTMQYAAPETLLDPPTRHQQRLDGGASSTAATTSAGAAFTYSEKSDLWSLGVCLHCLCYSRLPYEADTAQQLYAAIHSQPLHLPTHPRRSPELAALITALLDVNPNNRPDVEAILMHPHIRRRREERQSNMQQQQQQQRQPQQRSPQRRERPTQHTVSEKTQANHTAAGVDDLETGQQQSQQHNNHGRPSELTLKPEAAAAGAYGYKSAQLLRSAQTGDGSWRGQRQASTSHGVDQTSIQRSAPGPLSTHSTDQQSLAMSALSLMSSGAPTLLDSTQPLHSPSTPPRLSAGHNLQQSVGRVAQLAVSTATAVASDAPTASPSATLALLAAKSVIPRPHSPTTAATAAAAAHSAESSARWPARCMAVLSGLELLGHLCVVSWCAATVSAATLPLLGAVGSVGLWSPASSLPSATELWRACLLSPVVVPFGICVLSLALCALLPVEVLAALMNLSPLLRCSILSASGRACATAVMCVYAVLLLAVLATLR